MRGINVSDVFCKCLIENLNRVINKHEQDALIQELSKSQGGVLDRDDI